MQRKAEIEPFTKNLKTIKNDAAAHYWLINLKENERKKIKK